MSESIKSKTEEEPIRLEPGTEADVENFMDLENRLASKTYAPVKPEYREFLFQPGVRFFMIKMGDRNVGHISIKEKEGGVIYIGDFAIEPNLQGQGLGKKAMRLLMSQIENAPKIELVTHPDNAPAIRLYESFGFNIVDRKENYFGDGQPRVVMEKK